MNGKNRVLSPVDCDPDRKMETQAVHLYREDHSKL